MGLPPRCIVGTAYPCECPEGAGGYRYCMSEVDGWGSCECSVPHMRPDAGPPVDAGPPLDTGPPLDGSLPDAGPPETGDCHVGDEEWCDGRDNDCDAIIDEGHPCPDSTVAHTQPHDLAVWMSYRSPEQRRRLVRVWPEPNEPVRYPFPNADRSDLGFPVFHPNGGAWSFDESAGFILDDTGEPVDTPPCFDSVERRFGFDGAGRMHYVCDGTMRRGNAEFLFNIEPRGDYRLGVTSQGQLWSERSLFSSDGGLLTTPQLTGWLGQIWLDRTALALSNLASVFLVFHRTYRGTTRNEAVVVRVDADGTTRVVRRIPTIQGIYGHGLALPDGTYIEVVDRRVFEYAPGAAARQIVELPEEESQGGGSLFAAPRGWVAREWMP